MQHNQTPPETTFGAIAQLCDRVLEWVAILAILTGGLHLACAHMGVYG